MRARINVLTRSEHGVSLTGFTVALTAVLIGLILAGPDALGSP